MKLQFTLTAVSLALVVAVLGGSAAAKDPRTAAVSVRSPIPDGVVHTGSLAPRPKNWAAQFPDEAPAQDLQAAPAAQASDADGGTTTSGQGSSSDSNAGIVSKSNVHKDKYEKLPLFWLIVTGALSLCAAVACGSLVMRKDDEILVRNDEGSHDIPVISEALEVRA